MTEQQTAAVWALERLADAAAETRAALERLQQRRSDARTLLLWSGSHDLDGKSINGQRTIKATEGQTMQQGQDFRSETEREIVTDAAEQLTRSGLAAAMRQSVARLVCYPDPDARQAERDAADAELAELEPWSWYPAGLPF